MIPTIAAIIVNWNSRDDVLEGIRSLRDQHDNDLSIIVVDNGSTDGSVEAIRAEFPSVLVMATGENLGFAEGCNRGLSVAHADWVFMFNNDAVAEPGCIERLRKAAAEASADVGMIQPRLVFRHQPSRINSAGVVVFRNGCARDRHFNEPVEVALEPTEVFCVTAGAALYRTAMLEQVRTPSGYFDRRFFMYFEDVDLGWRCRLAGWRALYVPDAVVRHRFQASSSRRGRDFADRLCRINRTNMLLKNASVPLIVRCMPRTAVDLFKVLRKAGPGSVWNAFRTFSGSIQERQQLKRMHQVPREQVERAWITLDEFPAPALDRRAAD